MATEQRCSVRFVVFGASMREGSLNDKLASLAASVHHAFDEDGRIADSKLQTWFETTIECFIDLVEASKHYPHLKKEWVEFLGERPDAETRRVELGETAAVV
jgi:hypothetical protein